jgi:hypothetical protein
MTAASSAAFMSGSVAAAGSQISAPENAAADGAIPMPNTTR